MNKHEYYHAARKAGYPPKHAWHVAKTLEQWEDLEAKNLVRLRAEEEEERYIDVYGKPEAYTDLNGRRVSEEKALEDLVALLDRWGCVGVISEYWANGDWQHADSIGMCVYANPLDWRENWYVPDLMKEAIEQATAHVEEHQWASEMALQVNPQ